MSRILDGTRLVEASEFALKSNMVGYKFFSGKIVCPKCAIPYCLVTERSVGIYGADVVPLCQSCHECNAVLVEGWKPIQRWPDESPVVVPFYSPIEHGALLSRGFAIRCGTRWEATTETGALVQLPEDHTMVTNWKLYAEAKRYAQEEGEMRIRLMEGRI